MKQKVSAFFISVTAVITVTVAVIILSVSCSASKINFKTTFYFVCYAVNDNAVSASSMSDAVSSYGGAGYILEHGNGFYVTVACYYRESDAAAVCSGLKMRQLDCEVLEVTTEGYPLSSFGGKNYNLYLGNLNTLLSLSTLAYNCANELDTGGYSQAEAKSVIADVESGLKGLLAANPDNCFTQPIRRLVAECGDARDGYIYSKNLRKLQIAIADVIININLY
ncbi:MAG: hypothetical protein K2K80_03885 [Clostridia bacterium]|nr:hypothetical protein [Clostridia bacterium]